MYANDGHSPMLTLHAGSRVEVQEMEQTRPVYYAEPPVAAGNATPRVIQSVTWGWLPFLSCLAAGGLLYIASAYSAARTDLWWATPVSWLGFLTILVPLAIRLASAAPQRNERIGLVLLLGLCLYGAKVLHSPLNFTFSDEPVHLHNVNKIVANRHLFLHDNSVLPVTPSYPGLASITAALVVTAGLSPFVAGLLVIGAARLVISLALFLFWEHISRSARIAAVASVLYTANSNYVFWSVQFAYESLALPLATLVIYAITRREGLRSGPDRLGFSLTALLALAAVVVTHHMSSYALVGFLIGLTAITLIATGGRWLELASFAMMAVGMSLIWLVLQASVTIDYLSPVLSGAVRSVYRLAAQRETSQRQLFQSSAVPVSITWEPLVGLGSVLLILVGLPVGLFIIWRRYRREPFPLLLAGAALAYPGMLAFRLTSAGWETSNRSSAFLFVGLAFVLALAFVQIWSWRRAGPLIRAGLVGCVAVLFVGGIIAGWPPYIRLPRPYLVAGMRPIEPQGLTAARWAYAFLGPGHRIATDNSNARLMQTYGDQYTFAGQKYGNQLLVQATRIARGEHEILRLMNVDYVVFDRRRVSWNAMIGVYFDRLENGEIPSADLFEPEVVANFDHQPRVSRLFDSGNIAIYDVRALRDETDQ